MAKPRLHLDEDASHISLMRALLERGHDVTRTPNEWITIEASDEQQLLGAIQHGRCIFTFNVRDFIALAKRYPQHCGIILSAQKPMSMLFKLLDRLLTETDADDWHGQVRWLQDWDR